MKNVFMAIGLFLLSTIVAFGQAGADIKKGEGFGVAEQLEHGCIDACVGRAHLGRGGETKAGKKESGHDRSSGN